MAVGEHLYPIGWAWECMDPPIRTLDLWFAEANASLTPYLLGDTVDTYFSLVYPDEWIWREAAWKKAMNIQEDNIVIGEGEFIIYRANRAWMAQLWAEYLTGKISEADDYPCPCMNFGGAAVEIPNIWV